MKQKKSNRNMYAKDCVILMEKNKHYARTHIPSFDIFFETKIVKEHFNQHFSLIQFTHSIERGSSARNSSARKKIECLVFHF